MWMKVRCSYRKVHGTQLCIKDAGKTILFTSLANVVLNSAGAGDVSAQPG